MSSCTSHVVHVSRRLPLAAGISALFALTSPAAATGGTSWPVTDCGDSGPNTLRGIVGAVTTLSGDTVDVTACSTITLTTGAINVTQPNLTLHGPGRKALTITAKNSPMPDRIFNHNYPYPTGLGHLYIDNLRVGYGQFYNAAVSGGAHGGCIRSNGSVTLTNVGVYYCTASTGPSAGNALGGGVYAHAGLTIRDGSVLLKNTVSTQNSTKVAEGGGAMTPGPFDMSDSSIAENYAVGAGRSHGGGLALRGNVIITGSVIGGNYSSRRGGGAFIFNPTPAAVTTAISNSTITTNGAGVYAGGVFVNSGTVNINNSTIVLNTAKNYVYASTGGPVFYAAGVALTDYYGPVALTLQSTIIANNTSGAKSVDLSAGYTPANVSVLGSDNIVRAPLADVTLPSAQGNQTGVCPLLGPIRDNGGVTFTHALLSQSPGIDQGNNTANDPHTLQPALYDQRGPPYARVSNGVADIGAYEVQHDDVVFDAGFDGCPPL